MYATKNGFTTKQMAAKRRSSHSGWIIRQHPGEQCINARCGVHLVIHSFPEHSFLHLIHRKVVDETFDGPIYSCSQNLQRSTLVQFSHATRRCVYSMKFGKPISTQCILFKMNALISDWDGIIVKLRRVSLPRRTESARISALLDKVIDCKSDFRHS